MIMLTGLYAVITEQSGLCIFLVGAQTLMKLYVFTVFKLVKKKALRFSFIVA